MIQCSCDPLNVIASQRVQSATMRPRYCLHALLVAIFTSWGCLDAQDTGIAPVPPPRNAISADRMAQEYFENRRNQDAITMLLFGGVLSLVGIGFPTYMFILAGRKRVDRKFHNCIKKRVSEGRSGFAAGARPGLRWALLSGVVDQGIR